MSYKSRFFDKRMIKAVKINASLRDIELPDMPEEQYGSNLINSIFLTEEIERLLTETATMTRREIDDLIERSNQVNFLIENKETQDVR